MTATHPPEPMTQFEQQLAEALRAYANQPQLRRSSGEIVADVLAAPRRRRGWLVPAGIAAATLLVAAGLAGIRALDGSGLQVARATVNGVTYGLSTGTVEPLTFRDADLTPVGRVGDTNAEEWFASRTVFAVHGIDPQHLLVARASAAATDASDSGYLLLIGPGFAESDLCDYYDGGQPAICLREPSPREVP